VLLAAKLIGRPVKWVATRSESFLCDAQARDNVTDAELALDKDGNFLGFRAKIIAAIGAYLQVGMPAFTGNLGTLAGVYRTPASYVDVTPSSRTPSRCGPIAATAGRKPAYIIERMVDLAADQIGMDPAELRRRNTIPASAMPFKTSVTFTYDCGEFEKNMDMALDAADKRGFEARRAQSRKNGKLRGLRLLQHHRAFGGGRTRRRRDQVRPHRFGHDLFRQHQSGPGPRNHVQASGVRPPWPRSEGSHLRPGRHRSGVFCRRYRRLAFGGLFQLGFHACRRQGRSQGQGHRRPHAQGRPGRHQFQRRPVLDARSPTRL
jgi:hypothetical protein